MTARLTVDLDAIAANWKLLAGLHGGATAAVVKADAYGLGATRVAPRLYQAGARHFFVAHTEEALPLRPLLPGAMIGILNGFAAGRAGLYGVNDLAPVLGSLSEIDAFAAYSARLGRRLDALLHIDTGMCRLGLDQAELATLAAATERLRGINIRYIMTHLVDAERAGDPGNAIQLARFDAACARLPPWQRSLANSSGIFLGQPFGTDLARPGAALYGINPTPARSNPMRPVMRLCAEVLQLRRVEPGDRVGYNGIWTARRPTSVATVAAGYADGYHRALSNAAQASFDGRRVPLIGRVSMDLTTFDTTDHQDIVPGSLLELMGPDVPPDEVAQWAGTNGYEVLTSLGSRLTRSYGPL
jgi:alanine racemase